MPTVGMVKHEKWQDLTSYFIERKNYNLNNTFNQQYIRAFHPFLNSYDLNRNLSIDLSR